MDNTALIVASSRDGQDAQFKVKHICSVPDAWCCCFNMSSKVTTCVAGHHLALTCRLCEGRRLFVSQFRILEKPCSSWVTCDIFSFVSESVWGVTCSIRSDWLTLASEGRNDEKTCSSFRMLLVAVSRQRYLRSQDGSAACSEQRRRGPRTTHPF